MKEENTLLGSLKTGRETKSKEINTNLENADLSGTAGKRSRENANVNDKDIRFALATSRDKGKVQQDANGNFITNKKSRTNTPEVGNSTGHNSGNQKSVPVHSTHRKYSLVNIFPVTYDNL